MLLPVIAAVCLLFSNSYAEVPARVATRLATPIGRYLIAGRDGAALREAVGRLDLLEGVPRQALAAEIDERLAGIEAQVARYRALKAERGHPATPPGTLTRTERALVRELARRDLRFAPDPVPGESIRFVEGAAPSEEARFVRGEGAAGPGAYVEAARIETAPALVAAEKARVGGFFKRMRDCVRNQPQTAERRNFVHYLLQSVGVVSAVTVGSYVVGTGLDEANLESLPEDAGFLDRAGLVIESGTSNVSWTDLSTDLLVNVLAVSGSVAFMRGNHSFRMRWLRYSAIQMGRNTVDAGVYYFHPIADSRIGGPETTRGEATAYRFAYNSGWTAVNVRDVALFELTQGLMCLHPGSRSVEYGMLGVRLVDTAASDVLYYYLRNGLGAR